jgi:Flp pilus assembly protein TadB
VTPSIGVALGRAVRDDLGGLPTREDVNGFDEGFRPLRPESRRRRIAGFIVGPVAWLVAVDVATVLVYRIDEILVGVLVVAASFLLAVIVLGLLRMGRRREERRYAHRR